MWVWASDGKAGQKVFELGVEHHGVLGAKLKFATHEAVAAGQGGIHGRVGFVLREHGSEAFAQLVEEFLGGVLAGLEQVEVGGDVGGW